MGFLRPGHIEWELINFQAAGTFVCPIKYMSKYRRRHLQVGFCVSSRGPLVLFRYWTRIELYKIALYLYAFKNLNFDICWLFQQNAFLCTQWDYRCSSKGMFKQILFVWCPCSLCLFTDSFRVSKRYRESLSLHLQVNLIHCRYYTRTLHLFNTYISKCLTEGGKDGLY